MEIAKTIDSVLLQEQEERKDRKRSGKWTPSRFGRCYRFQYWSRQGIEPTNPPDINSIKRMDLGTLIHEYIQKKMKDTCEIEVEVAQDDVFGYADLVDKDSVADIKSTNDWAFKYLKEESIVEDKFPNWLQVACYAQILKKPKCMLFYVNTKDINKVRAFEKPTAMFSDFLVTEMDILREWWKLDSLPDALPRCYNGKECNYCGFKDKCFALEESKKVKETPNLMAEEEEDEIQMIADGQDAEGIDIGGEG